MREAKKTPRPLPRPDIYMNTSPFWEAAKQRRLMLQYCKDSNRYQWFPRPVSIYSGKRNLEWREASGKGILYTWTNTLVPWPDHEDRVPYVCALVDLQEGVRMLVNLINCDASKFREGLPVRLAWEKLSDDFNVPVFEPT
ncbi:OB-fold domain-containing protein [Bradyrhizobium tropiciagri]|uniref:Zn-ribbon domain-containing OB-fold protein n=1 Tax=Bradyrhizobium tropiciagri TaxID=312253 RepID=UPI001BA4E4D8|nr:OB-fold domain-containing protein [Bradyrhizobium tropiciagri]MBR0898915.1 OB-fold domain-containing protein [Bradyrhizobium tropiciagri]